MNISTYGCDKRLKFCRDYLLRSGFRFGGDIMLLPVPSINAEGYVRGTDVGLDDIFNGIRPGDAIVGYGLLREARAMAAEHGALIVDTSRDETFLSDNAALTSDGTLGRILTEHNRSLCDLNIGIIGYGRIGQRLLNSLLFFGADVTVFTSREASRLELGMLSVHAVNTAELNSEQGLCNLASLNILINTAPAPIITADMSESLSKTRIIELASGENIPPDIPYERFASVPAIMYPASAGYAMGRAVIRMLEHC